MYMSSMAYCHASLTASHQYLGAEFTLVPQVALVLCPGISAFRKQQTIPTLLLLPLGRASSWNASIAGEAAPTHRRRQPQTPMCERMQQDSPILSLVPQLSLVVSPIPAAWLVRAQPWARIPTTIPAKHVLHLQAR